MLFKSGARSRISSGKLPELALFSDPEVDLQPLRAAKPSEPSLWDPEFDLELLGTAKQPEPTFLDLGLLRIGCDPELAAIDGKPATIGR